MLRVRLASGHFPVMGTIPGQQVYVPWGPRSRVMVTALAEEDDTWRGQAEIEMVGGRADIKDLPGTAVLRVGAESRAVLGIPRTAVVTVRRRVGLPILNRLNELILPGDRVVPGGGRERPVVPVEDHRGCGGDPHPAAHAAPGMQKSAWKDAVKGPGVFWEEWLAREPGEERSLERAASLIDELGLSDPPCPVIEVVGSKGKGTTATFVSAYLAAAGLTVITVTSPELRNLEDRIRLNGHAVTTAKLAELAERLERARDALAKHRPGTGYLGPGGLFTVAGVLLAREAGADVLVLEAGMGGATDEISLFPADVVAMSAVFGEHLGKLGDTTVEIAEEKARVVAAGTGAVVSLPQTPAVAEAVAATVAERTSGRVELEVVPPGTSGIPLGLLPAGLGRANAELGCAAGRALLDVIGRRHPSGERLESVLGTVRLPGRASWHDLPRTRPADADPCTRVLLDAAISRGGVAAALAEAYRRWEAIDRVLLCMPDHKDVDGAVAELAGLAVTFVRLDFARLRFEHPLPGEWEVVDAADVDLAFIGARGPRVAALGTGYFVREMLDVLDVDTAALFTPPAG